MGCANGARRRNLRLRRTILAAMGVLGYGCRSIVITDDVDGSSGGTGDGTTTGTGTGAGDPGVEPFQPNTSLGGVVDTGVCEGARAIIEGDGTESGYAQCPDGTLHRYDASIPCEDTFVACVGTEPEQSCSTDADCWSSACASFGDRCECVRPTCQSDADCDAGEACVCGGVGTNNIHARCFDTSCSDGSACESGECGLWAYQASCDVYRGGLACRTEADPCRLDADCEEEGGLCNLYQGFEEVSEQWLCGYDPEPCGVEGRPLMIGALPRTAPVVSRGDWSASLHLEIGSLDVALREALADHWKRIAGFEHASVASFARFSLQLLALGAPPDLLAEAQAAALDEIEHARISYALASAYAGIPIGPGPLDLRDMQVATDRRAVMMELVFEACVGETLNAAEARECAMMVESPKLAAIQTRIAEDEERHAVLAWRTLAWLLEDAAEELRGNVAAAFVKAAAAARPEAPSTCSAREHGLLSEQERHAIRSRVLQEVILPCARTLERRHLPGSLPPTRVWTRVDDL